MRTQCGAEDGLNEQASIANSQFICRRRGFRRHSYVTEMTSLIALDRIIPSFLKWSPFLPVFTPVGAEFAYYGKPVLITTRIKQPVQRLTYPLSIKTIRTIATNPLLADTTAVMISISHFSPINSLLDKVLSRSPVTHEQALFLLCQQAELTGNARAWTH